jgi:hypothetical protein
MIFHLPGPASAGKEILPCFLDLSDFFIPVKITLNIMMNLCSNASDTVFEEEVIFEVLQKWLLIAVP